MAIDPDPKCGATSSGSSPDHDGPHVCDSPPGHPHMRNHGCACGYAWPATDQPNYWGVPSPADDPEALKREIGRIKAHFHKRCETLTARAQRAEEALATARRQRDELGVAVGKFEGGLDVLAMDLGCGTNWPAARSLIEDHLATVKDVIHGRDERPAGRVVAKAKTLAVQLADEEPLTDWSQLVGFHCDVPPGTEVAVVVVADDGAQSGEGE